MNRRNILIIGAVIVAAVAAANFFIISHHRNKPGGQRNFRIAAILPLTGEAAQYGNNDKEGILLAVDAVNAAGGVNGRQVEVLFEDCQTDAKKAVAAFNKLKTQGVSAVIDDAISTISLAMVPLLEPSQTILISTGASNPSLSGASPYFFRVWNSDAYEGRVVGDFIAKDLPSKSVGVLYINSDYGKGLLQVVSGILNAQVIGSEAFDKDSRDFRAIIAKLKGLNPEIIYIIGYAPQTGPLVKQIREQGVSAQLIGTVAMEDPEFLRLGGASTEGVLYPFPVSPKGDSVTRFKAAFREKYGKDPGLLHDVGFDAANLLIEAFRSSAESGAEIRTFLSNIENYDGASGSISFDSHGDVSKPMQIKTIRDGKFVPLQP